MAQALTFLEADIEEFYLKRLKKEFEESEVLQGRVFQQLQLPPYGVADIVTINHDPCYIYIDVYELKAQPFTLQHLLQVLKYRVGLKRYFGDEPYVMVSCHLVVPEFPTNEDYVFLFDKLNRVGDEEGVCVEVFSIDLEKGIQFESLDFDGGWHFEGDKQVFSKTTKKAVGEVLEAYNITLKGFEELVKNGKG